MCRLDQQGQTVTMTGVHCDGHTIAVYAFRPGSTNTTPILGTLPQPLVQQGDTVQLPGCGQVDLWRGTPPDTFGAGADLSGFVSGIRADAHCTTIGGQPAGPVVTREALAATGITTVPLLVLAVVLIAVGYALRLNTRHS